MTTAILLASYTNAQTSFAIRAGVNWQNINGEEQDGTKLDYKMATKFHVGLQADIPVATDFYFQPGLIFTTKGARLEETIVGENFKVNINIAYIDIPLSLVYKPEVGAGRIILGFGPYVGIGVGGKQKIEFGAQKDEEKINFTNDVKPVDPDNVTYYKRIDGGANVFVGYEFTKNLFLQLNTQLGLVNIQPKDEGQDDGKAKNTGFGISLGYRF